MVYGNHYTMSMWRCLVQMHHECRNVFLTIFLRYKSIHILGPFFYFLLTCKVGIIGVWIIGNLLVTKGQFHHCVMATLKNKAGVCADTDTFLFQLLNIQSFVWIFDAVGFEYSLYSLGNGNRLVDVSQHTTLANLEVEFGTCFVQCACNLRFPSGAGTDA